MRKSRKNDLGATCFHWKKRHKIGMFIKVRQKSGKSLLNGAFAGFLFLNEARISLNHLFWWFCDTLIIVHKRILKQEAAEERAVLPQGRKRERSGREKDGRTRFQRPGLPESEAFFPDGGWTGWRPESKALCRFCPVLPEEEKHTWRQSSRW